MRIYNFFNEEKNNNRFLLIGFLLSITYIIPVILSNTFYLDDLARVVDGHKWNHDGRYLASALYSIINIGGQITNISPYPQILSCLIFSFSYLTLAKLFDLKKNIISILACSLLLMSPLYLENISYKFDSLIMSISIFLVIYSSYESTKVKSSSLVISVISLTSSLFFYEPSIGGFVTISIALLAINSLMNDDIKYLKRTTIKQIFILVTSLALWKAICILLDASMRNTIFSSQDITHQMIYKSHVYLEMMSSVFSKQYILSTLPLYSLSLACLLLALIKKIKKWALKNSMLSIVFFTLSIPVLLILTQGVSFFSLNQTDPFGFAPRIFIGFGFTTLIISVMLLKSDLISNPLKIIVLILPVMYSLTLSSSYSNALNAQSRVFSLVASNLSRDISEFNLQDKKMVINGKMTNSYELLSSASSNPILFKLVQTPLNNQWGWGYQQLMTIYSINVSYPTPQQLEMAKSHLCEFNIIKSNVFYNLLTKDNEDFYILDFNKECG